MRNITRTGAVMTVVAALVLAPWSIALAEEPPAEPAIEASVEQPTETEPLEPLPPTDEQLTEATPVAEQPTVTVEDEAQATAPQPEPVPEPEPASVPSDAGPVAFAADSTLSGTITDVDGNPLAGVEIRQWTNAVTSTLLATTGADGGYETAALAPGDYIVGAQRAGYVPLFSGGTQYYATATPVSVSPLGTTDWSIELYQPFTLTFTAWANNLLVPGITVDLTASPAGGVVASSQANGFGEALFMNLEPGTYYAHIIPPAASGLAGEWWQDASHPVLATPIVVATGDPPRTLAATLEVAGTGELPFRVVNGLDEPLEGAIVELYEFIDGILVSQGVTDADGTVTFTGLPTGLYTARTLPGVHLGMKEEWWDDASTYLVSSAIQVDGVESVRTVELEPNVGRIAGLVTKVNGSALTTGGTVWVFTPQGALIYSEQIDTTGHFEIDTTELPAGQYRLAFVNAGGLWIGEYFGDTDDITQSQTVTLSADEVTVVIEDIELLNTYQLEITDQATGLPIEGAAVEVWGNGGVYLADGGQSDAAGHVQVSGDWGEIALRIEADGYVTEWWADAADYGTANKLPSTGLGGQPTLIAQLGAEPATTPGETPTEGPAAPTPPVAKPDSSDALAFTGSTPAPWLAVGVLAILLGALFLGRRRPLIR